MKKYISSIFILGVFSFLFWKVAQNWQTVSDTAWHFSTSGILLVFLSVCAVYLASAFSWHLVILALGERINFKTNFRIWMVSNFSRLIPGTIWQYMGRVYLLSREGVPKRVGTTAVIIEIVLNLSSAAAIVLLTLPFWRLPQVFASYRSILFGLSLLPLLLFFLTNQKILIGVSRLIKKLTGKEGLMLDRVHLPLRWFLLLLLAFAARFITSGAVLFFLLRLATPLPLDHILPVIGLFSLSWLIGYIVLLAPGGLGVMEISLATLLAPYMPFAVAAVIAIVFRLTLLVGEVVFLSTSLILKGKSASNSSY